MTQEELDNFIQYATKETKRLTKALKTMKTHSDLLKASRINMDMSIGMLSMLHKGEKQFTETGIDELVAPEVSEDITQENK